MFEGAQPWAGLGNDEVKRLVLEGRTKPKVPKLLEERGDHLVKLYNGCLSADSSQRPSLDEVVKRLSWNCAPPPPSMSSNW